MTEGPLQKALRHLREGDIDWRTVARGLSYYRRYLKNWRENQRIAREYQNPAETPNPWEKSKTTRNYDGITGFNIHEFFVKPTDGSDPTINPNFYLIDIPPELDFQLDVLRRTFWSNHDSPLHATIAKSTDSAIGIVGPLCALPLNKSEDRPVKLPNNGFYHQDHPELTFEFGETKPPGQRRGAIIFWKDKPPELVTDAIKWSLVKQKTKPTNLQAIVGTSNFITNNPSINEEQPLTNYNVGRKTVVTYLVSYIDNGVTKWSHLVINNLFVDRVTVENILNALFRDKPYFAVEMEMSGGGLVYKNSNGEIESWPSYVRCTDRIDMYTFSNNHASNQTQ